MAIQSVSTLLVKGMTYREDHKKILSDIEPGRMQILPNTKP
jgi:hypothetical protein